jgi:hypothetical protein
MAVLALGLIGLIAVLTTLSQLAEGTGWRLRDVVLALVVAALALGAGAWWIRRRRRAAPWRTPPPDPMRPYAPRDRIPKGMRFSVLQRDGFRCVYCGRGEVDGQRLHVDHLRPVSRGGQTTMDNLVTACEDCNLGKGASLVPRGR